MALKVVFDSNVWRPIVTPGRFQSNPAIGSFEKIHEAIVNGEIIPYICETVFTIESIQRISRKRILGGRRLKVTFTEENSSTSVNTTFVLGPGAPLTFENNPILKQHFDDAVRLGFRIIRFPRIGGLQNAEVEPVRFQLHGDALSECHSKIFNVGTKINEHGAGFEKIKQLGQRFDSFWITGLKNAPDHETGNIANAVAEWADGDSVAVCIGYGCDYFCTNDQAAAAGEHSILSEQNLEWLEREFQFKSITPEQLAGHL